MQTDVYKAYLGSVHFPDKFPYKTLNKRSYRLKDMKTKGFIKQRIEKTGNWGVAVLVDKDELVRSRTKSRLQGLVLTLTKATAQQQDRGEKGCTGDGV